MAEASAAVLSLFYFLVIILLAISWIAVLGIVIGMIINLFTDVIKQIQEKWINQRLPKNKMTIKPRP